MHDPRLLRRKEQRSHGDSAQRLAFPVSSHDAGNGVGVGPQQQMSHFVSHDISQKVANLET